MRLESRPRRMVVLILALAGAAWMAQGIVRPAVAEHLAQTAGGLTRLERAVGWNPGNPALHLRLADAYLSPLHGADLRSARVHLERALRLGPTDSSTWLALALLADRRGETTSARTALEQALGSDQHNVALRWEAALLALRWGERDRALAHLRYVLAVDPGQRDAAFQLARAVSRPDEPVANLLPREAEPLTGLLAAAVRRGDLALAQAVWERRARLEPPLPDTLQRRYLNLLLQEGEGQAARRVWATLARSEHPAAPENAVWNGGFETDRLLGWGFDWQVQHVWGVDVSLDRFTAAQGRQSLRLTFNSFPTLDFAGVFQLVAVEPGREYRVHALVKALDFATRSGLKLQVVSLAAGQEVLAETGPVAGTTSDWRPLEARVRIPADTSLVRVRLRRERAPGPEGNLGGKVWIDGVTLTPVGGSAFLRTPVS